MLFALDELFELLVDELFAQLPEPPPFVWPLVELFRPMEPPDR